MDHGKQKIKNESGIDYQSIFSSVPGSFLVLKPDVGFTIVDVSDAYTSATMTKRGDIIGKGLFEVFPDNPDDPGADGVSNLQSSLQTVLKNKTAHSMAVQQYDIRREDGVFEKRYWSPLNKPVLNSKNDVVYIIHRVEDVTDYVKLQKDSEAKDRVTDNLVNSMGQMEMEIYERAQQIQELNADLEQKVTERTEQLLRSEVRFRAVIEKCADMITLALPEGKILYISPSLTRVLGFEIDDYNKRPAAEFIHPDDLPGLMEEMAGIINAQGKSFYRKQRLLHKDGSWHWCEGTITNMLHDPDIGALVSNFRDITEYKKVEEKLQLVEKNYQEIFNKANDAIYVHELETGKVIEVNQRASEITGFTREELLNSSLDEFITDHPDFTIEHAVNYLQKAAAGVPQSFEWLGKRKDGSHHWYEVNLKRASIAGADRILAFFHEIDDRKKAEKEIQYLNENLERKVLERTRQLADANSSLEVNMQRLKDSEERFSKIFEENPVGISIGALESGIITQVNKSFLEIVGFEKVEVIGHTSLELNMILPDQREKIFEELKQYGKVKDKEITVRRKTGEKVPVLISLDQFKIGDKGYAITIVYDISERKKAEEQLTAMNKELEAFSYSISHDLRAPLRAINGFAGLIHEDYHKILDEEGNRLLGVVQRNAQKMGKLIDDLLAFSKLGRNPVKKMNVDMNELTEKTLSEIDKRIKHNAQIQIEYLHPVPADYTLMNQVMENLISNGIKYSSRNENPMLEIRSEQQGEEIIYSVKDNGVGFEMQYVHKLFGVFQRLHRAEEFEGTGVGLAIVQRIVNKHGGRVWAESKPNEGATFYFSLPLTENHK